VIHENLADVEDGWLFFRHSEVRKSRLVLLFIHGFGESGLCFKEALESRPMIDQTEGFYSFLSDFILKSEDE
jgi:hypothetical protein